MLLDADLLQIRHVDLLGLQNLITLRFMIYICFQCTLEIPINVMVVKYSMTPRNKIFCISHYLGEN